MAQPNPFEAPAVDEAGPPPGAVDDSGLDIVRVAVLHRRLNLLVLGNILIVLLFGVAAVSFRSSGLLLEVASTALVIGGFGLGIGLMVTLVMLTRALGWAIWQSALVVLSLFFGLINLIVLLLVIDRGTKVLKAAGLKVGLLGASPADVERWRGLRGTI